MFQSRHKLVITIGIYTDDYSWAAYLAGVPDAIAFGQTLSELGSNLGEAIRVRLSHIAKNGEEAEAAEKRAA